MTKKPQKPDKNKKYYCFNCGMIYEIEDNLDRKKLCPMCKGRLGEIIG